MKVGPSIQEDELIRLCETLNPENRPGRLTLIARFGSEKVRDHLDGLLARVKQEGRSVIWSCDPMHGNTVTAEQGRKTRHFDSVFGEMRSFLEAHRASGTTPGGIHLELTGEDVTECVGGAIGLNEADLEDRYHTQCDPRLNFDQSLELAFALTDFLSKE
jgi:3-deoxy-7-phosphoheptulonate synthase